MEVGCQGLSQNRLKSSITLCFFHSTWRLHNRKTHGRTLQLYHYIVLHMAWHLHSIAAPYITLQYVAFHHVALHYIAITVLRYVALCHVVVRHVCTHVTFSYTAWIALHCNAWPYSVHYLALICSICMHACRQTYFTTNAEINQKTDKQPVNQTGKQIDRHGDRWTYRDRYTETSHLLKNDSCEKW